MQLCTANGPHLQRAYVPWTLNSARLKSSAPCSSVVHYRIWQLEKQHACEEGRLGLELPAAHAGLSLGFLSSQQAGAELLHCPVCLRLLRLQPLLKPGTWVHLQGTTSPLTQRRTLRFCST